MKALRAKYDSVNFCVNRTFTLIRRAFCDESGATAIEYGLIAALIAVAAVTVMGTVGTNLSSTFSSVATNL